MCGLVLDQVIILYCEVDLSLSVVSICGAAPRVMYGGEFDDFEGHFDDRYKGESDGNAH